MNDDNFYSIDRLLEFGMGMSMAQQMVNMMNQTMRNMNIPGSPATIPQPQVQPSAPMYVCIDGQQVGPLTDSELLQMVNQHKVQKETLAWMPGMAQWQPIEQVPKMLSIIAMAPPPLPTSLPTIAQ